MLIARIRLPGRFAIASRNMIVWTAHADRFSKCRFLALNRIPKRDETSPPRPGVSKHRRLRGFLSHPPKHRSEPGGVYRKISMGWDRDRGILADSVCVVFSMATVWARQAILATSLSKLEYHRHVFISQVVSSKERGVASIRRTTWWALRQRRLLGIRSNRNRAPQELDQADCRT